MEVFDVDMEFLRRLGSVRRAAAELAEGDGEARERLQEALRQAQARVPDRASPTARLLRLCEEAASALSSGDLKEASPLGQAFEAALSQMEESAFLPAPQGDALAADAARRLLEAWGRAPSEWDALANRRAPDEGENSASSPTLDDLAALLIQIRPGEKRDVIRLLRTAEAVRPQADPRGEVEALLREICRRLEGVAGSRRVSKAARKGAVEEVSRLLEQALLLQEEAEALAVPQEPEAWRDAADPLPQAPSVPLPVPEEPKPSGEGKGEPPPLRGPQPEEGTRPSPPTVACLESEPMPGGMDLDLVRDFLVEAGEYLDQAEDALLALEADPQDREAVNVVFRAFHTIKGVSAFLELQRISDLAHHAESLLSQVRDGRLPYGPSVAELSLRAMDGLKGLLRSVEEGLSTGVLVLPPGLGPLLQSLSDPELPDRLRRGGDPGIGVGTPRSSREDSGIRSPEGEDEGELADSRAGSGQGGVTGSFIRVRTDRLDRLVDMVGELVIAHSMLAQDPLILRDRGPLSRKVDHAAKILRELQDLSTSLRMVPLKPAFRKAARTVRDLSRRMGKPVVLITEGEDTEIDRTMVDVLADPLVHMVRNSLDHGLETPEERVALGKPREGKIRIAAYQAGGNVVIEVADDGRGLDREKILARAREHGLVEGDRHLSDPEVFSLIFAPGFSTAEKVTEVSGRGVGMDVVRRHVESLRGRVSIESRLGQGATFRIHLPLTLAITDGMVVRVGRQRFIIPSVKIHMSLRPTREVLSTVAGRGELVLLQGKLLPILRLHALWDIPGAQPDPTRGILIVVGEGDQQAALLVDEIVTQQQFVVKPLSGIVGNTQGLAGGAILGTGEVGLILDPEGIVAMAQGQIHQAA